MITAQYVAKIIQTVMALDDGRIWVFNQRQRIPMDKGLSVVVGLVDSTPFGTNLYNFGETSEKRTVHTKETISIDIFSYDLSAVQRLPELIGSLNSSYSMQIQEQYGFRLATNPTSVLNTSEADGAGMLNRFTVTTVALRAYDNTSAIDYFDTFDPIETYTEQGEVQ